MESQDYPIRHFESMAAFATALKTIPAQILESVYWYETFGTWWLTLRCKGITLRAVFDGRERVVRLERSKTRKPPYEWEDGEPLWRKRLASGQLDTDAEFHAEIVRALKSL